MPYWRLSGFYLFYFASLGALIPYWSVYLKHLGFSVTEIGELMAILMATKIVAPVLWGWLADRTGLGLFLVHMASLLAALSFALVIDNHHFWMLALSMVIFSFFWNAALPQFEVVTLNHLGEQIGRYTRIRLWGSIGFILAVVTLGVLLETWPAKLIPYSVLILMVGIWLVAITVPTAVTANHQIHTEGLWKVLRRPEVIALFAVCLLMQASHGPYYVLYTLYMQNHGYSMSEIGFFWGLSVAMEVVVFIAMPRLVSRFGLRNLFLISLALATLRWILIGYIPQSLKVQIIAQQLHAATFGIYHAVAIQLIHKFFTGRLQGRGQALYSSISFGAGGAIGSFYSGYVWDFIAPSMIFYIAAVLSLSALIIAYKWIAPQFYK